MVGMFVMNDASPVSVTNNTFPTSYFVVPILWISKSAVKVDSPAIPDPTDMPLPFDDQFNNRPTSSSQKVCQSC